MKTWFSVPNNSDFSIYNLPFGIFSTETKSPRAGVAIGESIIDLAYLAETGAFNSLGIDKNVFSKNTLNDFISLGKAITVTVRCLLQEWLCRRRRPPPQVMFSIRTQCAKMQTS